MKIIIDKTNESEVVNETYLTHVKITPSLDEYNIEFELNLNRYVDNHYAKIEITYGEHLISETVLRLVRKTSNTDAQLLRFHLDYEKHMMRKSI